MPLTHTNIKGLTTQEVNAARAEHGQNILKYKKESRLLAILLGIVKEPMVILLIAASTIYFFSGETGDALFLLTAIILISVISIFQERRSQNALKKLQEISQPHCRVIRNGIEEEIKTEDIVIGDCLIAEEGTLLPTDGTIIHSNDFSVNESVLTGESMPVFKDKDSQDSTVFSGTIVTSGLAIIKVSAIGNATQLGKIGKSLESITEEKTPLEKQINNFVKKMVVVGAIVFILIWFINYYNTRDFVYSLLQALTLAMSILPEEIPVAFTTFMALGAWRLMQLGIVVKQMKTVETLGSATVICTDKTGTITQNKMALAQVYVYDSDKLYSTEETLNDEAMQVVTAAMWASEPLPFDPMEVALHTAYSKNVLADERRLFQLVHEYPIGGKPPMMTHVFEDNTKNRIIAAKGAPEALLEVCRLSNDEKQVITKAVEIMALKGHRVLGVGISNFNGDDFPLKQQDLSFEFKGLVAFYDPPKENIKGVIDAFYKAGIKLKIITGDNAATTAAIAKQIGFTGYDKAMDGNTIMKLDDNELKAVVMDINVYTRMFPEAKLRIINALKSNGQIVAMTGDGINDGPALKAANIGIAMGKKGTEIAKEAASLILLKDDLSGMVDAVAMGRKIYANLKKAIQYIISIHIPIILTVFIPVALGWVYPSIFSPLHVIFLELIMGPTCSVIYENEPMEKDAMQQKPRLFTKTFFNTRELATSIIQGLVIAIGTLTAYRFAVYNDYSESSTRTMVFVTLITANIALTFVNRSFHHSVFTMFRYKNPLMVYITAITVTLTLLLLFVPPLTKFFEFETPAPYQLLIAVALGITSVIWYEIVKLYKRIKFQTPAP